LGNTLRRAVRSPIPTLLTSLATDIGPPWLPFVLFQPNKPAFAANGACRPQSDKDPDMITGTVKFFNVDKGFGFIAPEGGGDDAFVHISAVERAGMQTLEKDQRVSYDVESDKRGKSSAVNLQTA
jgi:CspA family cold shock protein